MNREEAWKKFQIAADQSVRGTHNLELTRLARIFSTAPPDEQRGWEVVMQAACRVGHNESIKIFGFAMYNWQSENKRAGPSWLTFLIYEAFSITTSSC